MECMKTSKSRTTIVSALVAMYLPIKLLSINYIRQTVYHSITHKTDKLCRKKKPISSVFSSVSTQHFDSVIFVQ
jgi:hypothetical protein